MRILIISLLICIVASEPGLLRVPKVYNAVITSNQNLSPSRAYPVIQPVIHRTAIGYVPPFYYANVAPHLAGPEVIHFPRTEQPIGNTEKPEDVVDGSTESITEKDVGSEGSNDEKQSENDSKKKKGKKDGEEEVPLSFYPNYQSLYYDPYFYTYNAFNPHLIPGTYYVDYQPFASIPPIIPKPASNGNILTNFSPDENKDRRKEGNEKEKIPDVPAPPVPTSSPKNSR